MRIQVPPEEAEAFAPLLLEAETCLERRDFRQAEAAWERALEVLAQETFSSGAAEQQAEIRLARAELDLQLGRWDQAREDLTAVEFLGPGLKNPSWLTRGWLLEGRLHGYNGRYRESERVLTQALETVGEADDPLDRAAIALELGALHNKIGQHDAGSAELELAGALLGSVEHDARSARLAVMLACERGLSAFRKGRAEEARHHHEHALAIARQHLPRTTSEADGHRFLGIVTSVQGHYVEALRSYLRALEIYREQGALLGQAKVYGSIGQALLELSRVDEALFALNRARKLAVKLGADTQKATLYGKLGTIYREREEFDKAVEYHLKDVELARRFGNERALAFAFRNLGLSYRARGEGEEARSYLAEALDRFETLGDHSRVAMVRLDLAEVWLDLGRFQEAEEQILEARGPLEERRSQADLARLHLLHGALLRDLRRAGEAERAFQEALQILVGQQPSAMLVEIHYEMARLYQMMADSRRAVDHLKLAQGLARQMGLNRLAKSVVGLLEQINELELLRMVVQEVEREQAIARLSAAGGRS